MTKLSGEITYENFVPRETRLKCSVILKPF